jgi:internalin A
MRKQFFYNNIIIKILLCLTAIFAIFSGCQKSIPLFVDVELLDDNDGDGVRSPIDCNDADPLIYPGAPELIGDNKDNNCNDEFDEEETIYFPDENFKIVVMDALGLNETDVNNYSILELDSLNANGRSIGDLGGLEYAVNLKFLNLADNKIKDINPILMNAKAGGKFRYINLVNNSLDMEDCNSISSLFGEDTDIYFNVLCEYVTDKDNDKYFSNVDCNDNDPFIYPGAPELGNDGLDNNCNREIDEIEVVEFNDMDLKNRVISELGGKKELADELYNYELSQLSSLYFWTGTSEIDDLKGLEYAYNLTSLLIHDGNMKSIKELAGLTKLESLILRSPILKNISPIKGLANLNYLYIIDTEISDISIIKEFRKLNLIYLNNNNGISDTYQLFSILKTLPDLDSVNLLKNNIYDLSGLSELTNLIFLDLGFNNISDISELSKLRNLTGLYLDTNEINDISSLGAILDLTSLQISNNNLSDISILGELKKLSYLKLDKNKIKDISALAELSEMRNLILSDNEIESVSAIKGLSNLFTLKLSDNPISDITPLLENTGISGTVYLENNLLDADDCQNILELEKRDIKISHDLKCE